MVCKYDQLLAGTLRMLIRHAVLQGSSRGRGIVDAESCVQKQCAKSNRTLFNFAPPFIMNRADDSWSKGGTMSIFVAEALMLSTLAAKLWPVHKSSMSPSSPLHLTIRTQSFPHRRNGRTLSAMEPSETF